jgi:hypothetical protein
MIFILFYLWIFSPQVGLHLSYDIYGCFIAEWIYYIINFFHLITIVDWNLALRHKYCFIPMARMDIER